MLDNSNMIKAHKNFRTDYKTMAYITVYEDKNAAYRCLEAIGLQSIPLNLILIIDNSKEQLITHGLFTHGLFENVTTHHFPSNIGISGGIEIALRWAIEEGYDFLWTFDQDSIPSPNCLEVLLEAYQSLSKQGEQVSIVAPTAYDRRSQSVIGGVNFKKDRFIHHKTNEEIELYECDAPITSGSLININAVKNAEFPSIDLFIDGVDFDHGLKLRKKGFKNFIISKAKLDHNYANPLIFKILNFNFAFQSYSALRYYYSSRNTTYLAINYARGIYKATAFIHRIKSTFLKIVGIIICEPKYKLKKIYACLLGFFHGCIHRLGKTWE
jgi:rhamnosyltransferase